MSRNIVISKKNEQSSMNPLCSRTCHGEVIVAFTHHEVLTSKSLDDIIVSGDSLQAANALELDESRRVLVSRFLLDAAKLAVGVTDFS